VSAALAVVVARALQRDPERRFQSYTELSEALRGAGRVAEHAEVASFMRGGVRSLPAALVSSMPAPAVAPLRALASAPDVERVELFDAPLESESEPPLEPEMVIELEPDPPPSTPSARPERDRARARLELLVGTLVLLSGLAAVYAFWPRHYVASAPTTARPAIRVRIVEPRSPALLPSPPAAAVVAASATPEATAQALPEAAPVPSAAAAEPMRPRPARPRRVPKPARKPAEYIPDGI
jgi:hypothetical protein